MSEIDKLEPYLNKIIKRYIKAISSQHVSVRTLAIAYLDNQFFVNMLSVYKKRIYPMLVPAIGDIADSHWNK